MICTKINMPHRHVGLFYSWFMNLNDLLTNYKWDCGALKVDGEDVAFLSLDDKKVYILKTFLKHFNVLNPSVQIYEKFMTITYGNYNFRLPINDKLFILNSTHELCLPGYSCRISNLTEYLRIYKAIESYWDLLEGTAMLYQKAIKKSDEGKVHVRRMVYGESFDPIKVLGTLGLDAHMGIREYQLIEYKERYIHKLIHDIMDKAVYTCYNRRITTTFEFEERK